MFRHSPYISAWALSLKVSSGTRTAWTVHTSTSYQWRSSSMPLSNPPPTPARMHVAALRASDVPRYRELMLYAYAAAPDAFVATPEERAAEPESWWLRRAVDPTGLSVAFGAFHEGGLVGTVTLEFLARPKTRHKAQLIGMFVYEW